jgi:hypothetical protein
MGVGKKPSERLLAEFEGDRLEEEDYRAYM